MADKTWWQQSKGVTILAFDEAIGLIKGIIHELASSGGWEKAVEWLSKYGKSPQVDFSQFPKMPLFPP